MKRSVLALFVTAVAMVLTGCQLALDTNRNAQVPVYMLRIEKGGKFTLQQ